MVSIFLSMVHTNCVNEFGKYHRVFGSNMLIVKKHTLTDAKSYVAAKFAEGYYNHFDDLFRESKHLVIRRDKPSKHAIHTWSDVSFTLYPYRVGTPYVFNRCQ